LESTGGNSPSGRNRDKHARGDVRLELDRRNGLGGAGEALGDVGLVAWSVDELENRQVPIASPRIEAAVGAALAGGEERSLCHLGPLLWAWNPAVRCVPHSPKRPGRLGADMLSCPRTREPGMAITSFPVFRWTQLAYTYTRTVL
jgi:hypothetical protein